MPKSDDDAPSPAGQTSVEKTDMQAFARRLHALMLESAASQSDLARLAWGEAAAEVNRRLLH